MRAIDKNQKSSVCPIVFDTKKTRRRVFFVIFLLFVASKFGRCRTLNGTYVYVHNLACFCVYLHLDFIDVADVNFHFVNVYRMFEIA